jgi:hypothetical protein
MFFAMHMGISLQPDSITRCKQEKHNKCRLVHTADYEPFFCFCNAHGNNLQSHARSLIATKTHQNFRNHQNFRKTSHTKNTDNETSNHPGSFGFLQPEVLQTNSKLNSRNEVFGVSFVRFFSVTGMNNSDGSGVIIEPGGIDGGGVSNVA